MESSTWKHRLAWLWAMMGLIAVAMAAWVYGRKTTLPIQLEAKKRALRAAEELAKQRAASATARAAEAQSTADAERHMQTAEAAVARAVSARVDRERTHEELSVLTAQERADAFNRRRGLSGGSSRASVRAVGS